MQRLSTIIAEMEGPCLRCTTIRRVSATRDGRPGRGRVYAPPGPLRLVRSRVGATCGRRHALERREITDIPEGNNAKMVALLGLRAHLFCGWRLFACFAQNSQRHER